jgi:hypothetical protein
MDVEHTVFFSNSLKNDLMAVSLSKKMRKPCFYHWNQSLIGIIDLQEGGQYTRFLNQDQESPIALL